MVEVIGSSPTAPTNNKRASHTACSFVIGGDFGASTRRNRNLKPYVKFNAPSSVNLPRTRLLNAHHEKGVRLWRTPFSWWAIRDSNSRLLPCDGSTLPTELIARYLMSYVLKFVAKSFAFRFTVIIIANVPFIVNAFSRNYTLS